MERTGSEHCEVCSQPMEPGARPVRVGACEFPFYVHEQCRDRMSSLAGFVEELCRLAEEQPEGLAWLGSWQPAGEAGAPGESRPHHVEVFIAGGSVRGEAGRVSVADGVLSVDGWWPAAVRLQRRTFLLRLDGDPPDPNVTLELAAALSASGLRPIPGEWPTVEAITLQRLGLLGATWQVWAPTAAAAEEAVAAAAAGDDALPVARDAAEILEELRVHERGADRPRDLPF